MYPLSAAGRRNSMSSEVSPVAALRRSSPTVSKSSAKLNNHIAVHRNGTLARKNSVEEVQNEVNSRMDAGDNFLQAPSRSNSCIVSSGRPTSFSSVSPLSPNIRSIDEEEDLNGIKSTLYFIQRRLRMKKCKMEEKEEDVVSREFKVTQKKRLCLSFSSDLKAMVTDGQYWTPTFETRKILECKTMIDTLQCEIAKEVEQIDHRRKSLLLEEDECMHLEKVAEGLFRDIKRQLENKRSSVMSVEHFTLATDLEHLRDAKWYWGSVPKKMARNVVRLCRLGSFLVRDSASVPGEYVLVFKMHEMIMMQIKHEGDRYGLSAGCLHFSSIPELVCYYCWNSLKEVDPSIDLKLTEPIEKYDKNLDSSDSSDDNETDGDEHVTSTKEDEEKRDGGSKSCQTSSAEVKGAPVPAKKKFDTINYLDVDKVKLAVLMATTVSIPHVVDYIPCLAQHWELIGCKLEVGQIVRNIRETQKNNISKLLEVLEGWLEQGGDKSWEHFLDALNSLNLSNIVQMILEKELKKGPVCTTPNICK